MDVWNAVGREIFNVNGNLWMTGNNDSIILGAGKQAQTWFDGLDWNFVNGQSGGEFNFYNQTGYGVPQIYAVLNAHDFVTHSFNATDKNTLELFTEEQTIWDVYRNQTDMNRPVIKTKCEWQLKEDFIKLNKTEWLKVDNVVAVNKTSIKKCWNETTYPFHISVKGTSQGQRSEDMEATLKQLNKGLNIIQIENETAIDTQIILANEIYTKSKVPDVKGKYFNLFDSSIYSKLTHFAYTSINGQPRLNQETRDVAQEGYLACDRECTLVAKETNKFKDYLDCKVGC